MKSLGIKVFAGVSLVLVGMGAMPSVSSAQSAGIYGGDAVITVQYRDDRYYRPHERRYDDRYDRRREDRRERAEPGCPIRSALVIAGRHIRQPQVASVTRRYIIIDGYGRRGEPNQVVIQNDMSCKRVG